MAAAQRLRTHVLQHENRRLWSLLERLPHREECVAAWDRTGRRAVGLYGEGVAQHGAHAGEQAANITPQVPLRSIANLERLDCIGERWRVDLTKGLEQLGWNRIA